MSTADIEALIRSGLPDASVRVVDQVGDGNHFQAVVVTGTFAGKSLVERHQLVYGSLKGAMADRIHALSIKAYTPDEWARAQR
jgi:acid stress-induced BolA-like protein IbaG/YrbA